MAENQATAPAVPETPSAAEAPGQEGSVLTGKATAAEGTTPSAEGATPKTTPAWVAQLEGDLQKDEVLTRYKTISELGKAHRELVGKLSGIVAVPGKDATAEDWAAYRKAIGVPEKATGYKLEVLKLPKEIQQDQKLQAEFLETSLKAGLTNQQANWLYLWYASNRVKAMAAEVKAVKTTDVEADQALRQKWGANYDRMIAFMGRAAEPYWKKYPDLVEAIRRSGLGNHVGLIEMLAELGQLQGEHPFVDGRTPAAAVAEFGQHSDAELAKALYGKKET
jgi:hypothetical protein